MIVRHRFELPSSTKASLRNMSYEFGFNGLGEAIYYRSYSRNIDGQQETWPDTIIRCVEGVMSIRKSWHLDHGLPWEEIFWNRWAHKMGEYFIQMKCLPPGRGLRNMGTDYVYERGSMCLNNCAASGTDDLANDCVWIMDSLMSGCGVGFGISSNLIRHEIGPGVVTYSIPDSREGWCESVRMAIDAFLGGPAVKFDYSDIRPSGSPIRGLGGISSGYEPLERLHEGITQTMARFLKKEIDSIRAIADVINMIGVCVVSGNIRRSAQIAIGSPSDQTFMDLKNYELYEGHREGECRAAAAGCRCRIGWASNNSVCLGSSNDFAYLPTIASLIKTRGEPGFINLINIQKYGRHGKKMPDRATLVNPCGEIPLENKELCNLAEVFPSRCDNYEDFTNALDFATFYASTVALCPTHSYKTNVVIARNRRIGVSLTGIADWMAQADHSTVTRWMKDGYKDVRETNRHFAVMAGVPPSVRVTTVKPSGTLSKLVGVSAGIHPPSFTYSVRRVRVPKNSPICRPLAEAGYPHEPDSYSDLSEVFEFPIYQGTARPAREVSAWEQCSMVAMAQREWSDNSVSATVLYDKDSEEDQVEHMISQFAPVLKSMSVLPHSDKGCYVQPPEEGITVKEYKERLSKVKEIEWEGYNSDALGEEDKYCEGEVCKI